MKIKDLLQNLPLLLCCLIAIILLSVTISLACRDSNHNPDSIENVNPVTQSQVSESQKSENQSDEIYVPDFENDKQTTFGTVIVISDSADVYEEAGSGSKVIGHAGKNTVLAITRRGNTDGFYQVSYSNGLGYVLPEQVQVLSGEGAKTSLINDEKLIALTFDDGPSKELTPGLLDILKKEDVKVTFFALGSSIQSHPDIVKRAAQEGHQIASHTFNHKSLTKLSSNELDKEISDTAALIRQHTGLEAAAMRPPYGDFNDAVLQAAGMPVVLWTIDPMDWKFRDADIIYQNVVNAANDGDIILLHDIHSESIKAAAKIIPALKANGFRFVTVDELMAFRGEKLDAVFRR